VAESVVEVAFRAVIDSVEVANVFHWHTPATANDAEAVLEELSSGPDHAFRNAWLSTVPTQYSLHTVSARSIWREGDGFVDDAPVADPTITGGGMTATGDLLSPALTQVATLYTARTGRRHRGRIHFPSGYESQLGGRQWQAGGGGGVISTIRQSFLDTMLPLYGASGSTDFTMGIFSKADVAQVGASATLDDVFQPWVSHTLRTDLRYLRTRAK
jgi:hypothetical protein